MGADGALCFNTLLPDSREIPKAQWDVERMGQVCSAPQNFADTKGALEKLCHETRNCIYIKKLQKFFQQVEAVQTKVVTHAI